MNSTCEPIAGWDGLPKNWTSLLSVQEWELLPWSWQVRANNDQASHHNGTFNKSGSATCPSTAAKLTAFAAANIAMAILVPIVGRRDVMKKLTRGFCGRRGSWMWIIVGPLTVVLHIVSNTVGALLIRSTPGYQDIDVGQLILLWCTRPRMAWMVIALIPWQAKNAIYFSVAASSILSEAILQILGSVYMGIATAYAGRQKFYRVGRLRHVPHGTDALVMYAGSLLWLVMIIFALVACGWTLLNVNRHVAGLAQRARGLPRQANKQHRTANHRIGKWVKRQAEFQKRQGKSTRSTQECDTDREALVAQYLPLRQAWQDLASRWANLHEYLTEDVKAIKAARKDLRKRGQMLRRAKRRSTSTVIERRYFVDAQSLVENLIGLWRSKPANSLEEVQEQNRLFQESQNAANESKRNMLVRLNEEEKGYEKDWRRLEEINKQIRDLDRCINLKPAQLQGPSRLNSYTVDGPPEAYIRSLRAERERLVAERGSKGPGEAGSGLLRRLARYKQYLPQLAEIHGEWGAIVQGWDEVVKSVMTLENRWGSLSTQRQREEEEEKQDPGTKLRVIAAKALVGMIGCWAAQWVWWVGYIRLAGDS
jgi:hypothetical protein